MQRIKYFILLATGALLIGCMGDEPSETLATAPDVEVQSKAEVEASEPVTIDCELRLPHPQDFVETITNRYLPLTPGKVFRYEGETDEGLETIVTEVTTETKTILGIVTTVVRDREYLDDELIEETLDWFAQDEDGNVWYFGEFATFYENGQPVNHEGSWEAGVDGAEPGIIMLAKPREGARYAQENAPDVAEDMAKVVDRGKTIRVEYGRFRNVLVIKEWNPLEDGEAEYKFYARGVGLILEAERRSGRGERVELVSIEGGEEEDDDAISQTGTD